MRDALDDFENDLMPTRQLWIEKKIRVRLFALNAVVDCSVELAEALVEYGRGHEIVRGLAQMLYLDTVALLGHLQIDEEVPRLMIARANAATLAYLDVASEHGYGTQRAIAP